MQKVKIEIINKLGLHARASAKLVALSSRFGSTITIKRGNKVINAKSIMGVMMLAASQGAELELEIEGEDESAALEAITTLINNRFDEEA